ncbi:MAG: glycoside hydrolase family 27 protein, partial [Terriglobia bacterium]
MIERITGIVFFALAVSSIPPPICAATLAPAPPMGWNSWDAYGTTVREEEVKANADYMAKYLAKYGWQYIVVDIEWYTPRPKTHGYIPDPSNVTLDNFGRLVPAIGRFPSAAGGSGFTHLADYVHSKGLKFGIHIMRGIPREAVARKLPILGTSFTAADVADTANVCPWTGMVDMYGVNTKHPGGQAYYDSIVKLYAQWGVDYIKADDMSAPVQMAEIAALHQAILHSGRPIVLSLSPGPAPLAQAAFFAENANLWRISGDFWDAWPALRENFDLLNNWSRYVKPGNWPDADMLPLGRIGIRGEVGNDRRTRFTPDEQRTHITLWCIARSPLMFGGDLPSNDPTTLALITNEEVLAANQKGTASHQLFSLGDGIAWISTAPDGVSKYLAVFNVGD